MKILFVGKKHLDYNRVQVLLTGLSRRDDVDIIKYEFGSRKVFDKNKFKELVSDVDYIYIPPFRHQDIKLIKRYSSKPLIFDPLISKFMTKVVDYGHFWKAPIKYWLDFVPFFRSQIILTDTLLHKQYFEKTFRVDKNKVFVLPIGVDIDKFKNTNNLKTQDSDKFVVGFYGSFIPLQGVDVIIEAAKKLRDEKNIFFELIGDGVFFNKIKEQIKDLNLENVHLKGWVDYDELSKEVSKYDLCLGIFGNSLKADIVVPNKVWHYASLSKCIITKNTPGIKEIFTDRKNILLCDNTPEDLAKVICEMKNNSESRDLLGLEARTLMLNNYNADCIAEKFVQIVKQYEISSVK